jgi:hypothetical protein
VTRVRIGPQHPLACHHAEATGWGPVRIQVRIGLPHPLVSRKRRLNGGGPLEESGKTEASFQNRCGTIKIPPCSKAMSATHRPKFGSPSPLMVTSPLEMGWILLHTDTFKMIRYFLKIF